MKTVTPSEVSPNPPVVRSDLDRALATSWGRWFLPSFSDFFYIAVTLWLFSMGLGWSQLLLDGDTGWHIRTGEYILSNGTVPKTDIFSWSKAGSAWYAWEWLTDVLYAKLYSALGLKGIVLVSGLLITGTGLVTARHLFWRKSNAFLSIALTLLMLGAASIHYHARPHIFTLFLLAVTTWMISAERESASPYIWLLVPICLLWTNLHGGFAVLIALVGLTAGGTLLEQMLAWYRTGEPDWRVPARWFAIFAACAAATLVNPFGYHLHQHMAQYLNSTWIRDTIQEFQSPNFRSESMMQFEALLLVGLACSFPLLSRGRFVEPLWIAYFAHQSLASARHVTLYVIVITPLIGGELTRIWLRFAARQDRKSVVSILEQLSVDLAKGFRRTTVWTPAFVVILFLVGDAIHWPKDFSSEKFPIAAIEKNSEVLVRSRLLTTDQWGDYLLYRYYPKMRVFIDGRSDFYGPEIGKDYLALMGGAWNWRQLLERYQFDAVFAPIEWPLNSLLKADPGWQVVTDDGKVILFRRLGQVPVLPDTKKPGA